MVAAQLSRASRRSASRAGSRPARLARWCSSARGRTGRRCRRRAGTAGGRRAIRAPAVAMRQCIGRAKVRHGSRSSETPSRGSACEARAAAAARHGLRMGLRGRRGAACRTGDVSQWIVLVITVRANPMSTPRLVQPACIDDLPPCRLSRRVSVAGSMVIRLCCLGIARRAGRLRGCRRPTTSCSRRGWPSGPSSTARGLRVPVACGW